MNQDPELGSLKKNLETLADRGASRSAADLFASAQSEVLKPKPVRRRALASAAAALLLIAGVVAFAFSRDEGVDVRVGPATSPTTTELGHSFPDRRWTALADTPENVSNLISITDTGVLAWNLGAEQTTETSPLDLSASFYDFASETWTQIEAPAGKDQFSSFEASQASTIWTGSEVMLFVTELGVDDLGNSVDDTMQLRTVSWAPGENSAQFGASLEPNAQWNLPFQQVRTTGQNGDVLVLVSRSGDFNAEHKLWRYKVESDSWEELVDPPQTSDRIYGLDWTGNEILLTSGIAPPANSPINLYGGVEVLTLDPRVGPWETATPAPETLTGQSAGAVWDGTRLVVISYAPSSAFYDPETNSWETGDDPPIQGCEDYPAAISTADGVVFTGYCDRFAETTPQQTTWDLLPGEPVWPRTATGDLIAGLRTWDGPDAILVMPLSSTS